MDIKIAMYWEKHQGRWQQSDALEQEDGEHIVLGGWGKEKLDAKYFMFTKFFWPYSAIMCNVS